MQIRFGRGLPGHGGPGRRQDAHPRHRDGGRLGPQLGRQRPDDHRAGRRARLLPPGRLRRRNRRRRRAPGDVRPGPRRPAQRPAHPRVPRHGVERREIEAALVASGQPYRKLFRDELLSTAATALAKGKIVGWFQGREEWGPRALGNRSILCHPGWPGMEGDAQRASRTASPSAPSRRRCAWRSSRRASTAPTRCRSRSSSARCGPSGKSASRQ